MNKEQACKALGISLRTLERRMRSGELKFSKLGEGHFAEISFSNSDLGLPEPAAPEPEADRRVANLGPLASPRDEMPKALPISPKVLPRLDCPVEELEFWDIDDLKIARREWLKPDDPQHGTPTNAPANGSSTMPSPENYARFNRASYLIFIDEMSHRPPRVRARQHYYGQGAGVTADCAAHNSKVANLGREL